MTVCVIGDASGVRIAASDEDDEHRVLKLRQQEARRDHAHARQEQHHGRHLEDDAEGQDQLHVQRERRLDARLEGHDVVREAREKLPGHWEKRPSARSAAPPMKQIDDSTTNGIANFFSCE